MKGGRVGADSIPLATAREDRAERGLAKIRRDLGPKICGLLEEPNVVEIMLNPDGLLWVERQGKPMEVVGPMAPAAAESLIVAVAGVLGTVVTRDHPILECELPLDGSRFEALVPPIVSRPTFTIRRKASTVFSLADYVDAGIMTPAQRAAIEASVAARENILIVGGTGTGKTTLVNGVIRAMSDLCPEDRLVIIEDTNELQSKAENTVFLRTSDQVDMQRLLRVTMRMRPDRILVGEVRGAEALTLIKAWNTGHPGGVATVHANSAHAGLLRLESLCSEASATPRHDEIAAAVNTVVSIAKTAKGRRVREVLKVRGYHGGAYVTEIVKEGTDQ